MNRLFALCAIGLVAFSFVVGATANLGSGLSTGALAAAAVPIEDCGNPGATSLSFEYANTGTGFVVTKAILTASSVSSTYSFTASPTCDGLTVTVNFGATQVLSRSMTSGDFSSDGKVLTLDVTDTSVTSATNFSVLIR